MKVALITGITSDLGFAIAKKLISENIIIIGTYYNNINKSLEIKKYLNNNDNNSKIVKCDVREENEVKALISEIFHTYKRLDIVINNAALSIDNEYFYKTGEEFLQVLKTNLVGPFLVIKYAAKIMQSGIILNVASSDGIDTYNEYNIDYSASKSGLINITKNFANILKKQKVLAIAPNFINTSSIRKMNQEFLKNELKRVNQNKLIEPIDIAIKINDIIINSNRYKSGEIIRIEENE